MSKTAVQKSTAEKVRMESPDALFAPDHYVETPIPAPLYLLSCIRLPLETAYPTGPDGTVANPAHAFQRNELSYPDGSRFWAEITANPMLGLPNVYDLDYLLGSMRMADAGNVDPDGRLRGTYSDVVRATRDTRVVNGPKVLAAKRALARWANTTIRTALEMNLGDEAERVRSGGAAKAPPARPRRLEREATHWILEYDWQTEYVGSRSRDVIGHLKLNPIWREQTDSGLTAWIDIEVHNSLQSSIAKQMYVQLVLSAARASLSERVAAPLDLWEDVLGMRSSEGSTEKPNQRAQRVRDAVTALVGKRVLSAGEVVPVGKGEYDVLLQPGEPLTARVNARGIGSLDPIRTRTLLWHLGRLGFRGSEARALLAKHGIRVQEMLRRVHYERTVKGGIDAKGQPVLRWESWLEKGLAHDWKFDDSEYSAWVRSKEASFTRLPAPPTPAPVQVQLQPAAADTPAGSEPEVIDTPPRDVWEEATHQLREEIGDAAYRMWLGPTWLDAVEEERVRVGTTNEFAIEWIRRNYARRLEAILAERLGRTVRLETEHESARPELP